MMSGVDMWVISPEERVKHDAQFVQLVGPLSSHITGDQARNFFLQSGLPSHILGQIWSLADVTADGRMDRKEFSIAMWLIKRQLQGLPLPAVLPLSLLTETVISGSATLPARLPQGSFGGQQSQTLKSGAFSGQPLMHVSNGVMASLSNRPASPAQGLLESSNNDWAVPPNSRLRYNQMFNIEDRKNVGFLSGLDARHILVSTGLPQNVLAQIWSLADVDGDGRLTVDEFCLAMHLSDLAKSGQTLPMLLPPSLVPPSMRPRSSSQKGTSQTESSDSVLPSSSLKNDTSLSQPVSLEDKRRHNFVTGAAELERRRAELREQQRREEEERLAKERAEQEKKEAIRREQERKRQLEQERLLEKQRQLEAEREEQRRRALEAKEAARKEMERQRQREWEQQRKDQLLSEKKRQLETTSVLENQVSKLKFEVESLENKKLELADRIAEAKENVIRNTSIIDGMRNTRDGILRDIESNNTRKESEEQRYKRLCLETDQIKAVLQNRLVLNPLSDSFKMAQHSHATKRLLVAKLQESLSEMEASNRSVVAEVDVASTALKSLQASLRELTNAHNDAKQGLASQKAAWEAEKRRRLEEAKIREKREKEREQEEKRLELESQMKKSIQKPHPQPKNQPDIVPKKSDDMWGPSNTDDSTQSAIPHWNGVSANPSVLSATPHNRPDLWPQLSHPATPGKMALKLPNQLPLSKNTSNDSHWTTKERTPAEELYSQVPNESLNDTLYENQDQVGAALSKPLPSEKNLGTAEVYEALYDFIARNRDELSLNAGDKVKVYASDQEDAESGWLAGWKGETRGFFPENYAEKQQHVTLKPVSTDVVNRTTGNDRPSVDRPSSPVPGQGQPARSGLRCVAVNTWRAKKPNHLSFEKGQEIVVTLEQDDWWEGKLANGQQGWFPKSYVKECEVSSEPPPQVPAVPSQAEKYVATHPYQSSEKGDLNFQEGDIIIVQSKNGEWWTGQLGDTVGMFPASYVKKSEQHAWAQPAVSLEPRLPATLADKPAPTIKTQVSMPDPSLVQPPASASVKEIGRVIAEYVATSKEQLSLKPNQLIHIIMKSSSGWWKGELVAKGQKKQIGWFPKDYVKVMPGKGGRTETDTPSSLERAATPVLFPVTSEESPRSKQPSPVPVALQAERVQSLYPYTAQNADELTLEQGSIITVTNKDDPDWWMGELGGATGLFPANYVQPYKQPLTEQQKKRQLAIDELMRTEESYVNDMNVALEVFYKPLREFKVLPDSELEAIFVNWQELIHCNRKLVSAMKIRSRNCGEDEEMSIGDILVENFPIMTPYIRFCSRQLYAAQLLQKRVETDSEAKQFIGKCQQDPRVSGMPLSSYILKPMQRITKYPLLVERIRVSTSQDHPDYSNLCEALTKCEELVSQVNEGVREEDNSDKLEWVQNHVSCEGLSEQITFNSLTNSLGQRKYLYSGGLTKLRSGRELYAFLFNDFLLFTTATSNISAEKVFQLDAKGTVFKMYKSPLFLNEITVREPVNPEKPDPEGLCFQICHIEIVIDIKCSSTLERNAWMKRLMTATEACLSLEKVKRDRAQSLCQPPVGRLILVLREAVDLIGIKPTGKSDPYCEVSIGSQMNKTKVIQNTLNPKWNSSMQFPIKSIEDDVLCFTVFDQDRFSPNDFLGRTELRIKDILKDSKEKRGPVLKTVKLQEVASGEIVVKLDLQLYMDSRPRLGQSLMDPMPSE